MAEVTLKDVGKVYSGGVTAVSDFDLEVKDKDGKLKEIEHLYQDAKIEHIDGFLASFNASRMKYSSEKSSISICLSSNGLNISQNDANNSRPFAL